MVSTSKWIATREHPVAASQSSSGRQDRRQDRRAHGVAAAGDAERELSREFCDA
jgi:hypothetical protein